MLLKKLLVAQEALEQTWQTIGDCLSDSALMHSHHTASGPKCGIIVIEHDVQQLDTRLSSVLAQPANTTLHADDSQVQQRTGCMQWPDPMHV